MLANSLILRQVRKSGKVSSVRRQMANGVIHGECEIRGEETEGVAVHLAARVAALADSGEVLVSRTVRDLVAGSDLEFTGRGTHEMRGFPEEWQVYSVN